MGFCPAIAGGVLDDEFPSSGIFVNHAAHFTDELIGAALGDAENPSRVPNRSWLAVVDSYRLRHQFSITRRPNWRTRNPETEPFTPKVLQLTDSANGRKCHKAYMDRLSYNYPLVAFQEHPDLSIRSNPLD
jgi:hypothetical protein